MPINRPIPDRIGGANKECDCKEERAKSHGIGSIVSGCGAELHPVVKRFYFVEHQVAHAAKASVARTLVSAASRRVSDLLRWDGYFRIQRGNCVSRRGAGSRPA